MTYTPSRPRYSAHSWAVGAVTNDPTWPSAPVNGSTVVSSRRYCPLPAQVSSATWAWPGTITTIGCMFADWSAEATSSAVSMQMPERERTTASGVSTRWNVPNEYDPML